MAVLERDDFFARVQARIGEDSSDDAIAFMEDMADTYNAMEQKATGDGVDWEKRYKELDESWKKRYTHRFFSSGGGSPFGNSTDEQDESSAEKEERRAETITYGDLFKRKDV